MQKKVNSLVAMAEFATLPNEILVNIFEQAVHGSFHCMFGEAVRLSHVCRRFRDIALSCSALWTVVSDSDSPVMVDVLLTRSRKAGLRVSLYGCKRITQLLPHADR